jgi:2-keto-4-pentenoate hydratase/2-oxohepta-3-ene-1,7-dioic acid hydratase in catechol pathway
MLNGEVMQDWNTDDMIFDVPAIIAFLSASKTLLPGTVILTGTPHGVGFARNPARLAQGRRHRQHRDRKDRHAHQPGDQRTGLMQWELFVIISGTGTVRANKARFQVKAGDVIMHPPGEAHQITNTGKRDLVFYIIADNPPVDGCHYPDSKKWSTIRPRRRVFRISEVDYFDGEE